MKCRFSFLDSVKPIHGSNEMISVEVDGHMTQGQLLDALSNIWEYVEDETLIEHFRLEGWELRRLPQKDAK